MCKVCKRRGDLLLHPHEEEREKKGIEEVPAESSRIIPEDLRRRPGFLLRMKERWYDNIVLNIPHASANGIGLTQWEHKEMLFLKSGNGQIGTLTLSSYQRRKIASRPL